MFAKKIAVALLLTTQAHAFVSKPATAANKVTALSMENDRRSFLNNAALLVPASFGLAQPASAQVYLDPAIYGDQELRQSAVNSLKESVRRAILQDPQLAPSFYQLSLLDGLSFDVKTNEYGPDGRVVKAVLSSKDDSQYMQNLKKCCDTLIASCQTLKRLSAITIADAVALGGVAAIESVGGPFLSVQLGRLETKKNDISPLPLNIFSGDAKPSEVTAAFTRAGLTEREMTAILGTLLTLNTVQKTRSTDDWKESAKPKFREPGKIGRASEFRALTDQDIADLEDDEDGGVEGDDGWYIAESFGSRDESFGAKIGGGDINEKSFNKYVKELYTIGNKGGDTSKFGWIADVLLDKDSPTTRAWLSKYAGSYLNFNKDLAVAFNAVTQLGAEYTGGKYENLLKNRKRKTLNDDDLNLF